MPVRSKRVKPPKVTEPNQPLYPEVSIRLCTGEEQQLTYEQAKQLIGWQVEDKKTFGTDYLLKDTKGRKIRCAHNVTNRPFYNSVCQGLIHDILNGNWRFNGEPIIVGEYGFILNGQHTLIALILANEMWEKEPDLYPYWDTNPTIQKVVVFGIKEDDKTVNTMDTCKPRSLADVLYRSSFFADCNASERRKVARTCSFAIRTIWDRLGIKESLSIQMTHSELMTFLESHKRLIEAVNFIQVENGHENHLLNFGQLGNLSGLFYLMASSNSDPEKYRANPMEDSLDFSNWSRAEDFFVLISSRAKTMKPLWDSLKSLGEGSRKEHTALLAKAWTQWLSKDGLSEPIELKYVEKEGMKILAETPSVGGIDGIFLL